MSRREKVQIVIIIVFTLTLIGGFTIRLMDLDTGDFKWSIALIVLSVLAFTVGSINVYEIDKADELKRRSSNGQS
jgi:SNF family Na+-dependent transporter